MPIARRPTASVVIATHGRPELIERCVAAVLVACGPDDDVIVATSGTGGDLARHPQLRVIHCVDWRKDAKVNLAARISDREVIVLTDDDCIVADGWVSGMAASFADPAVGVTFGPVRGLTEVPGGAGPPLHPAGPAPLENWQYAHGASMAVRRLALLEVGGLDERLGPGASAAGEEADLVVRLAAAGWASTIADAPVVHHLGWRDEREEAANQLVYERGAGVWIGAGLRRSPLRLAPLARLRLRYQRALYEDRQTRGVLFGPKTSLAFLTGLAEGIRMPPRRFIPPLERPPHVLWVTDGRHPHDPLLAAMRAHVTTTVVAAGAGGPIVLRREVRRLEPAVDMVVVDGADLESLVAERRAARWILRLRRDSPALVRRASSTYDGLVVDGAIGADRLRVPTWVSGEWRPTDLARSICTTVGWCDG